MTESERKETDERRAFEATALEHFTEYFVKNYPGPTTIIGNPNWHAPKVFRAALYALEAARAAAPAPVAPSPVAAPPAGWKLVPLEPTPEMASAAEYWAGQGFDWPKAAYRAMLAAAPVPPSAWMPIAAAPQDGRTILLGYFNSHGKWRTLRGQWMSQDYINENWEDPDVPGAEAGWFETAVEADDVPNCWNTTPTHWMPLPSAPQEAER